MDLDTSRPFTRAVALRAGITDKALRGPRFTRLHHDVHIDARATLDLRTRIDAALLAAPAGSVVSHHTAAELWRTAVPPSAEIHLRTPGSRIERDGIFGHVLRAPLDRTWRDGVPLTTPTRTYLDLAQWLNLVDMVVLGDSLVARGLASPESLVADAGASHGRGTALARRAASLVRRGVDSPMESRLRMLIVLAGLPEPAVNHLIVWPDGQVRFRLDLAYPELGLAVEYDGRQHAQSTTQWGHDLHRREWLDANGWRILVLRAEDLYGDPAGALQRISDALVQRGSRRLPVSAEWRRHFPVRAAA